MQKKAALRKRLRKLGVNGVLITDLVNIRYLTGFTGSSGFLIITQKEAIFITDFRYKEQAKEEVKGFSIRVEPGEMARGIKKIVDEYGIKRLGFEDHNISYGFYKKLLRNRIRLRAITGIVEPLRLIKSKEEIFYIKIAVKRAERAFRRLQPFIRRGATGQSLAIKLEGFLKEEGCKKLPFGVIVASGSISALPHAKATNRTLKREDLVVFDWGGECEGYYSDMTRTVLLRGKNIGRQRELYFNVLEAQRRAIKEIRPGVKASVIDGAARGYIKHLGYGDCFGHGTGHGVGLAVHEKPFISWRSKEIVEEGMVFTVEPGIYIPDFGGVRIEDMMVVRKNGVEMLTTLPKRLKIIEG